MFILQLVRSLMQKHALVVRGEDWDRFLVYAPNGQATCSLEIVCSNPVCNFPVTVIVPALLVTLLDSWQGMPELLISKMQVVTCIVGLMVYVIMPRYTRKVAAWL